MKICWNITNKCSSMCKHCFRNKGELPLSFENNVKILEKLVGIINDINFSGGDAFMYPNFIDILKKANELGFTCSITTNGQNINKTTIDSCIKYLNKITFSVDYIDDSLNEIYGRGKNYYSHIKRLISYIKEKYPEKVLKINTIAMKTNFAFFNDIYNELVNLKISTWKIMEFCPLRDSAITNFNKFSIDAKIISKIRADIEKYDRLNVIFEDKNEVQSQIIISPAGNLCVGKNDKEIILLDNIFSKKKESIRAVISDNYDGQEADVNLNLYKTFFEVASVGSITAASKKLYISQPAISKSISRLESKLNVKLFYRDRNGVKLTSGGKIIYGYIDTAFHNIKMAERYLSEEEDFNRGKINIGVPSHIGTFYIFDKLKDFHREFPKIKISIVSRRTNEFLELLSKKELDIVIDSSPIEINDKNVVVVPLKQVYHCFFCSTKFYNNVKHISNLKDIADMSLILPIKKSSHRQVLEKLAEDVGVSFNNVMSIETSEMIVNAVKSNIGIGYVVYDLIKEDVLSGILKKIDLEEELPKVQINLIYNPTSLTMVPKNFINDYLLTDTN